MFGGLCIVHQHSVPILRMPYLDLSLQDHEVEPLHHVVLLPDDGEPVAEVEQLQPWQQQPTVLQSVNHLQSLYSN